MYRFEVKCNQKTPKDAELNVDGTSVSGCLFCFEKVKFELLKLMLLIRTRNSYLKYQENGFLVAKTILFFRLCNHQFCKTDDTCFEIHLPIYIHRSLKNMFRIS